MLASSRIEDFVSSLFGTPGNVGGSVCWRKHMFAVTKVVDSAVRSLYLFEFIFVYLTRVFRAVNTTATSVLLILVI